MQVGSYEDLTDQGVAIHGICFLNLTLRGNFCEALSAGFGWIEAQGLICLPYRGTGQASNSPTERGNPNPRHSRLG